MSKQGSIRVEYPPWIERVVNWGVTYEGDEAKMGMVLDLVDSNRIETNGSPYAAAVFQIETGRLVSVGVNMYEGAGCVAHAPIVAILKACEVEHVERLVGTDSCQYELFLSSAPCGDMCLGAVRRARFKRVVFAAPASASEKIGKDHRPFDPAELKSAFVKEVRGGVLEHRAKQQIADYARSRAEKTDPKPQLDTEAQARS